MAAVLASRARLLHSAAAVVPVAAAHVTSQGVVAILAFQAARTAAAHVAVDSLALVEVAELGEDPILPCSASAANVLHSNDAKLTATTTRRPTAPLYLDAKGVIRSAPNARIARRPRTFLTVSQVPIRLVTARTVSAGNAKNVTPKRAHARSLPRRVSRPT